MLARAAVFANAARVADIGIAIDQVRRLIFFVLRPRMIKIRELVEGEFAIALGIAD